MTPILDTVNNEILAEARDAATNAGAQCVPTPIGWRNEGNGQVFIEADGLCGNAYIKMPMKNNKFANWCKKNSIGRKSMMGGWDLNIPHDRSQSYERHCAAANAFAAILKANGIKCVVHDYID